MDASIFLIKGIMLGFSIAAPVGPIGLLCIRRTLTNGMSYGLISGLGAATADAIYGCVAAFGITAVSSVLLDQGLWLRLCGGLFLLYLGYTTFHAAPPATNSTAQTGGQISAFLSTFLLTLTNPMTVLSFAAIFAGLGAGSSGSGWAGSAFLVLGVFAGSLLWWILLAGIVGQLRTGFDARRLSWVNRFSGAVICLFGLLSISSLLP